MIKYHSLMGHGLFHFIVDSRLSVHLRFHYIACDIVLWYVIYRIKYDLQFVCGETNIKYITCVKVCKSTYSESVKPLQLQFFLNLTDKIICASSSTCIHTISLLPISCYFIPVYIYINIYKQTYIYIYQ